MLRNYTLVVRGKAYVRTALTPLQAAEMLKEDLLSAGLLTPAKAIAQGRYFCGPGRISFPRSK